MFVETKLLELILEGRITEAERLLNEMTLRELNELDDALEVLSDRIERTRQSTKRLRGESE